MYDYVLQFGFDIENQKYIESIKQYLKENKIKDKEKNWLPHITIDLYNSKNEKEFIKKIDSIVNNIECFNLNFNNLNDFDKATLYLEPFNADILIKIKIMFDNILTDYRLETRKQRIYQPHVTLCTNDNINEALTFAKSKFKAFKGNVKYLWIYNSEVKLIKEYELKENLK